MEQTIHNILLNGKKIWKSYDFTAAAKDVDLVPNRRTPWCKIFNKRE